MMSDNQGYLITWNSGRKTQQRRISINGEREIGNLA